MKSYPQFIITGHMVRDLCAETPRGRLLHRLHCVALVNHGLSASEVSRIYDDSPRAVAYWVKRFKQKGLAGLEEEARSGRPSKLTPAQMKKLQAFLKQSHARSQVEKAKAMAGYILKEFGMTLTVRRCLQILKRLTT
jgi:transposase